MMMIAENDNEKICRSKTYNYNFNKKTGFFARWGKTFDDDPAYSPFGCEIADIETTTICQGVNNKLCNFCYKSNTPTGKNMSFETFKKIFHKLPRTLTQIALGVDSQAKSNPDLFRMMNYCRNNDYNYVIPNITVAQIDEETADKLSKVCGAVAVSRYDNKNICYDSVKMLTDRNMSQINIHIPIFEEMFEQALETLSDKLSDKRLEKLNAIVFLSLKKKGRGKNLESLSFEKFKELIDFSMSNNIKIGFDSCSCPRFLEAIKNRKDYKKLEMYSEPCESGRMSIYLDVFGNAYPCSFCEGILTSSVLEHNGEAFNWKNGINVLEIDDFVKDVWNHPKMIAWRDCLCHNVGKELNCIKCPVFDI